MVQVYDVRPGQLQQFEQWFAGEGRAQFLAQPGLIAVDTFVDRTRSGPRLVTVLTFADDAALLRFTTDATAERLGQRFDDFIGPHGHDLYAAPPHLPSRRALGRAPTPGSGGRPNKPRRT